MRSFALGASLLALVLCTNVRAEAIRVGGTGSGVGTLQLLGRAFEKANPQHRIEVLPAMGSSAGIKALRAGRLQISVSNRDLTPEERSAGLVSKLYATTPLAVVTHADVPATAMTRDQLAKLLSGQEPRWSNGRAVRIVLRPLTDGDSVLLSGLSPAVGEALRQAHQRAGLLLAQTDTEAADYIERTPMAMGTATLAQVTSEARNLNVLSLDGAPATPAALESGRYPLSKNLLLNVRADASDAVKAFVTFVATSPEASQVLRRTGHVSR